MISLASGPRMTRLRMTPPRLTLRGYRAPAHFVVPAPNSPIARQMIIEVDKPSKRVAGVLLSDQRQ